MVNPQPQLAYVDQDHELAKIPENQKLQEMSYLFSKKEDDDEKKPPKGFEKFWQKDGKKEES